MDPLAKALDRLAKLRHEQAELERFIAMYHELAGTNQDQFDTELSTGTRLRRLGTTTQAVENSVDGTPTKRTRSPRTPPPGRIVEIVERVMRETGQPMSRGAIVRALEVRDVEIPGSDKPKYVGTIMWRSRNKFVNLPTHGYWFKNEDYEPANFKAGDPGVDPAEDDEAREKARDEATERQRERLEDETQESASLWRTS